MTRLSILVAALSWASIAAAQEAKLGPTQAVAVGVTDVDCDPRGRGLIYMCKDPEGTDIGIWDKSGGKSNKVMRVNADSEIKAIYWLGKSCAALVQLSIVFGDGRHRGEFWLVRGENLTATRLGTIEGSADSFSVDVSPTRDHAVMTQSTNGRERTYVLLDGGKSLVYSPDIDRAKATGASYLGWSADGTAYFSQNPNPQEPTNDVRAETAIEGSGAGVIRLAEQKFFEHVPVISFVFRKSGLLFAAGALVQEVVPNNGTLRQVRAKDGHNDVEVIRTLGLDLALSLVQGPDSKDQSRSLWIRHQIHTDEEEAKPAPLTILVSADADGGWLPFSETFVAYTRAGALFVRTLLKD